ncbi:hypothetical protein [Streptomyces himalayensis]|uniref:Secreted protein/lipoprotein n=1 Tax=Streptomyces himalayensis subsp. himalayensis TaxID=2756131 RepID=A0A7W0IBN6_9ACTN|nr:hypothetical protein [Streptomyces himalayensis]MBA2949623.1 hypothetical protein [Streptomyces himalayensis subsp. himalayensis]
MAGCSDNGTKSSPPEPNRTQTASPSPSSSSAVDPEEAAVLAAYTRSWEAQTEAYAKASSAGTDLKNVTTLQALAGIEDDLSAMRKAGQLTTGKPVIHPKVTKVTDAEIPTATISDCVDTTNWTLVEKDSKKNVPLPSERLTKYVSTATLEKWGTKWMVTKLTAQDQTC